MCIFNFILYFLRKLNLSTIIFTIIAVGGAAAGYFVILLALKTEEVLDLIKKSKENNYACKLKSNVKKSNFMEKTYEEKNINMDI